MNDYVKYLIYFILIPLLMWILTGYSVFVYVFIMIIVHTLEMRLKK